MYRQAVGEAGQRRSGACTDAHNSRSRPRVAPSLSLWTGGRRHQVGGSSDDPALRQVLETFSRERLPADVVQGNAVRKGAAITFSRGWVGLRGRRAGGWPIGTCRPVQCVWGGVGWGGRCCWGCPPVNSCC